MYRTAAVVAGGLALSACSDGGFGPSVPGYTVQVVVEGPSIVVELNDAGQALLRLPDGAALWTPGHGLESLPLAEATDLGPNGEVIGLISEGVVGYWSDGVVTDLGPGDPIGIAAAEGRAYFTRQSWVVTWDGAIRDSFPTPGSQVHWVGEDGTLFGYSVSWFNEAPYTSIWWWHGAGANGTCGS